MLHNVKKSFIVLLTSVFFMLSMQSATAGMVTTQDVTQMETTQSLKDNILSILNRDELKQALTEKGVDIETVEHRLDSLTDEELAMLHTDIDNLPKGAGILGIAGAVLVVLLILEVLGVTNVFTKI